MDSGELQYTNIIYVHILNIYIGQRYGQIERAESVHVGLNVQYRQQMVKHVEQWPPTGGLWSRSGPREASIRTTKPFDKK